MPISITMEELMNMPIKNFHDLVQDTIHQLDMSTDPRDSDAIYLKGAMERLLKRSRLLSEVKAATSIKTIATIREDLDG